MANALRPFSPDMGLLKRLLSDFKREHGIDLSSDSMAMQRLWGTGKIEARPDQSIRRPMGNALHMAARELAPRHRAPDRIDDFLGVLKAFLARDPAAPKGSQVAHLGIDVQEYYKTKAEAVARAYEMLSTAAAQDPACAGPVEGASLTS